MSNVSIADIVHRHYHHPATPPPESLIDALVQREEAIADTLRMAGVQFGLYPQIVAEVLAEVEMGEPITRAQRTLIRQQFEALMVELQRQHDEGHGV
jgi:hypothetical protein